MNFPLLSFYVSAKNVLEITFLNSLNPQPNLSRLLLSMKCSCIHTRSTEDAEPIDKMEKSAYKCSKFKHFLTPHPAFPDLSLPSILIWNWVRASFGADDAEKGKQTFALKEKVVTARA